METSKSADFKSNVADLTRIPPNEFEKYFQEWMERDDVARSLQAKLRCDLIKNFNKTNLGKHILSHTMTSSGGTTMRLTLSPLVLALNTLVAEFLYAQNCHFTLSVFCTEIPFRNTLPDFESMRKFRFNKEEISEIWRAVTGFKADKRDLNKHIVQNYEMNPNMSLLLLIIKHLLKRESLEEVKRNAEVQTESQEKSHKSTSAQIFEQERKYSTKVKVREDSNLYHINKYLLTLSEKVIEMTREFEQFSKQRHKPRTCTLKSSRSREYHTLNQSLECITTRMKAMAQAERENKSLSNIIESIDNLTQQFGKCVQNFDNVTKFLASKENSPDKAKPRRAKVKLKEQQTETETQTKSYNDWINEMRNTENGRMFLDRVEISLRKALARHQERLKNETDIKIKHLRSLMKLHYQQKLSKQLLQEPKVKLEEARKYNDEIERKLEQFERKQLELLQKLQESSLELKEAQLQQKLSAKQNLQEEVNLEKGHAESEYFSRHTYKSFLLEESEKFDESVENVHLEDGFKSNRKVFPITDELTTKSPSKDVLNLQHSILDVARNIAEEGRSVDEIIYDAKLRLQQLENESHQLEQNFQCYLERRKRCQEQDNNNKEKSKIQTVLQDIHEIATDRLRVQRRKIEASDKDEEKVTEELQRLKEKFYQEEHIRSMKKTAESDSSTSSLEIKNAILEAKLKFFEHESTIRKCREQEDELRTGNSLQKHLEKYCELQELQGYASETNVNCKLQIDDEKKLEHNTESSLSEINIKDKTLDEEQDIDLSPMTDQKSQKSEGKIPVSVRRELFPKHLMKQNNDLQPYFRYHESTGPKYIEQKDAEEAPIKRTETTSNLIKQSMTKMQLLFEQQSKSQETLKEIVSDLQQQKGEPDTTIKQTTRSREFVDKSLTTTTATATTNTSKTSEGTDIKSHSKISQSVTRENHNAYGSGRSLLILSNGIKESFEMKNPSVTGDLQKLPAPEQESNELEITISSHEDEVGHVIDSPVSYELQLSPKPGTSLQPKTSDLNDFGNEEEIGEILTESDQKFTAIDDKLFGTFSSQSSSDLEISVGHQNTDAKNLAGDSESDFWA